MLERRVDHDELRSLTTAVLEEGSRVKFRVRGQSMAPFIQDGDVAIVEPIKNVPSPIRRGDVVLCALDEHRLVVHRVRRILRSGGVTRYAIQGNGVARPDGCVEAEQILGRVTGIERGTWSRDIDTAWQRLLGLLWIWASPFSQKGYRVLKRVMNLGGE
ncbi:MAG: S24/S26 family peptidase [Anaerolineae bacterium]